MRRRKIVVHTSLFAGMYAITATLIGIETGSLVSSVCMGFVGTVVKFGWHLLHARIHGSH